MPCYILSIPSHRVIQFHVLTVCQIRPIQSSSFLSFRVLAHQVCYIIGSWYGLFTRSSSRFTLCQIRHGFTLPRQSLQSRLAVSTVSFPGVMPKSIRDLMSPHFTQCLVTVYHLANSIICPAWLCLRSMSL
jgi:hypothetical protein